MFKLEKLYERRLKLCVKFANKEYKKPNNGIFKKNFTKSKRANKNIVCEPRSRKNRHFKSAVPYT